MSYGPSPNKGQCPLLALRGGYSCSNRPDGCAAIASGCKLARLTARSVCTGVLRMAVAAHTRRICATAGLVIFLAASLGCPAGFAAESKRVMLLHSFGRDFKPWSEYARTIRMELDRQSPWPLDITEHSLVTARSPDENPEASVRRISPGPLCQTPSRHYCEHRRSRSSIRPATPAATFCHHPDGAHGCGTTSGAVF